MFKYEQLQKPSFVVHHWLGEGSELKGGATFYALMQTQHQQVVYLSYMNSIGSTEEGSQWQQQQQEQKHQAQEAGTRGTAPRRASSSSSRSSVQSKVKNQCIGPQH